MTVYRSLRWLALAVGLTLSVLGLSGVQAQTAAPPQNPTIDQFNVNLPTGEVIASRPVVSIGPSGHHGLALSQTWVDTGWRYDQVPTISGNQYNPVVSFMGETVVFDSLGSGNYENTFENGATLFYDSGTKTYTYTSATGVEVVFQGDFYEVYGPAQSGLAYPKQITWPDGVNWTYHYKLGSYQYVPEVPEWCMVENPPPTCLQYLPGPTYYHRRLDSITSNTGYQIKLIYYTDTVSSETAPFWNSLTSVMAINNAVEFCSRNGGDCSGLTGDWPTATFANGDLTNPAGDTIDYTYGGPDGRISAIQRPGASSATVEFSYDTSNRVDEVTSFGSTWTYDYYTNATWVTNPRSGVVENNFNADDQLTSRLVQNQTTTYTYCASDTSTCREGRLQSVELPEGQTTAYEYDTRGNVTQVTATDSNDANPITTSATYLATCTNPVICNRPTSTTDAAGNTTNYAYNATHGGMTMHRFPSSGTGEPRSRVTYLYTTRKARYLTGTSTWSNSGNIYVPLRTTRCQTAEVCSGTVNEARVEYAYAGSTTPNNLQPISVTTKLGNNTEVATSSFTYTDLGQVESIDGPLAGTADTSWNVYDDYGRMIGSVSADPDGAGGNDPLASRVIITDGLVTARESGTATSTDLDNDFTADQREEIQYDDYGRAIIQRHVALSGTEQYRLQQVSYNDLGLVECTALRLNGPSTTTGLSTACTPMTAASPSPGTDRISKRVYDNYGRVIEVRSGVGTTLEQVTQTLTYRTASTQNGQIHRLTDANDNRTEYDYDDFGRLYRTYYPHPTVDDYANPSDYDQVTFDSAGRADSFRTRAGETFDFTYDNLGRLITVEVPDRAGLDATHERDVWYDYDLMGNMTHAYFDCLPGASCGGTQEGISYTYNALGQVLTSSNNMDGVTRTVTSSYDVTGRRTGIIHPDNIPFTYIYDLLGRLDRIENIWSNWVIDRNYTAQGRLSAVDRPGALPDVSYGYDAAGRLDSLDIVDPNSTSYDAAWNFAYNSAGQTVSETRDNNLFAFGDHVDLDLEYVTDGLNQYDSILDNLSQFTNTLTHSANGNLTDDGTKTYVYDTENRLVEVTDGSDTVTMRYDPLGRLYEVEDIDGDIRRLYYDGSDLILEYDGAGIMLNRYLHGASAGDDPLIAYEGNSVATAAARSLYADRLGSIVLSYDLLGGDTTVNAYDEFGVPDQDNDGRFQYTGQAWVPEIGMFYYKARMYSPTLGRFMQTDPIGYADGMNMYAYVGNDPVNGVDPTGLFGRWGYCEQRDSVITVCGGNIVPPIPGAVYDWFRDMNYSSGVNFTPQNDGNNGGTGAPEDAEDENSDFCEENDASVARTRGVLGPNITNINVWTSPSDLRRWESHFETNLAQANFIISTIDAGSDLATIGAAGLGVAYLTRLLPFRNNIQSRVGFARGAGAGLAVLGIREAAELNRQITEGQLSAIRARIRQLEHRMNRNCQTPRHDLH